MGHGESQDFPWKFFCLKMPTKLSRKTFCDVLQKFSEAKKFMDEVGGGGVEHQDSPSNFFYRTLPKKSRGEYLKVSLLSGIENFLDKRGGISRFSVEKFLSHIAKKFRRGTLLCCVAENFRKRKLLWLREEWEHQDYPSKLVFYLTVLKISRGRHP